jgi:hypothetical protein
MIGLQPFKRPWLQCAFAVKISRGENFANISHKVQFKQRSKWNQKIHDTFYLNGKNILFPDEEIADVAKIVKESMAVSKLAIERYCDINGISENQVIQLLNDKDLTVIENLNYKLSRQQRRKLEREYKGRPYGDVQLRSRLSYIPQN